MAELSSAHSCLPFSLTSTKELSVDPCTKGSKFQILSLNPETETKGSVLETVLELEVLPIYATLLAWRE